MNKLQNSSVLHNYLFTYSHYRKETSFMLWPAKMPNKSIKAETIHKCLFSVPIKGISHYYALLHCVKRYNEIEALGDVITFKNQPTNHDK